MWSRKEVKAIGKAAFKANYWKSVLVSFILMLLAGGTAAASSRSSSSNEESNEKVQAFIQALTNPSSPDHSFAVATVLTVIGVSLVIIIISLILKIFLFNPLQVGCYGFFRENVANNGECDLNVLSSGFSDYMRTFVTLLLRDIYLVLWSFLFIIPGIIKSYSYRMVPYLLRDRPDLTPTEVITLSRRIMKGNKWKAFVLDLSFIGWHILGLFTLGILGIFWTKPYIQNSDAALYLALTE